MAYLLAAGAGLVFGALDQYLGSLSYLGAWASSLSVMSAPWLALPFLVGVTQEIPRRAALLGLAATLAALAGYFALTLSPLENVPLSAVPHGLIALLRGQLRYVFGGVVSAPIMAMLGMRWHRDRAWWAGSLLAAAFCLEPLARLTVGQLLAPTRLWIIEAALGACLALGLAAVAARTRLREPG